MSYTLRIGKARYVNDVDEYGDYRLWDIDECEGPAPHTDEYEMTAHEGSPVRSPGYGQWHECMKHLPTFYALWNRLEAWSREHKRDLIPVTEYVRELDAVEQEAASVEEASAARAYWFSRWSRHALKLYGEAACFETPGEWINWHVEELASV